MNIIAEAGYILSRQELIYLAAFTGKSSLIGITDNTMSLNRAEILECWPEVENSLYEKKYLTRNSDGKMVNINSKLFEYIGICVNPRMYLSCTKHTGYFNCYFKKNICVKLEQSSCMNDTFTITPLLSYGIIRDYVFNFFMPDIDYVSPMEDDTALQALPNEETLHSMLMFLFSNNVVSKINTYKVYICENTIWSMAEGKKIINRQKLIDDLDEYIRKFRHLFEAAIMEGK